MGINIITIGREFGSGGRELGRRLADELGFAYYDKEILYEIADKTPYSQEYLEELSERRPVSLYPIHYGNTWGYWSGNAGSLQEFDVFKASTKILREVAMNRPSVFIGRCSDYLLNDLHPLKIFVYADMASKIARCRAREHEGEDLTDKQIARKIKEVDRGRKRYYEFYTGQAWGAKENYDLMINTTGMDIKKLAHLLALYIQDIDKSESPKL